MMMRKKSKAFNIDESPEVPIKKVLCYGDVHRPFQDPDANWLMWKVVMQTIRPQMIVNMGDELDFPEISYFRKEKPSENAIVETIYGTRNHFSWLRETFPDAEIWWLPGNHDQRWSNFLIDKAPEITVLPDVHLEHILELDEQNIKWKERKPKGVSLNLGHISVGHWNQVSKHSGYTAKLLVEKMLHSCVQAHTHRLGAHYHTGVDTELVGFENGCLCRLDPHYEENPNWQQGFSVINITPEGYFKVENIEIVRLPKEKKIFLCYGGEFYWQEMTI
jgi:hypothetical protein